MTKTFGTAKEAREYLVGFGFPPFRKGQVKGEFTCNGKIACLSMGIIGKTGQSSTGAGWGYVVSIYDLTD